MLLTVMYYSNNILVYSNSERCCGSAILFFRCTGELLSCHADKLRHWQLHQCKHFIYILLALADRAKVPKLSRSAIGLQLQHFATVHQFQ